MTAGEYFDLYFSFEANVQYSWNFFLVFTIASVGWLLSLGTHPTRNMKLLASVGYGFFLAFNLYVLIGNYALMHAVQLELQTLMRDPASAGPHLRAEVLGMPTGRFYRLAAIGSHFLGAMVILAGLWSDRIWKTFRASEPGSPGPAS